MAKHLLPQVAKLLGMEIGEEFIIENADHKETVVLGMDGLHVVQPNNVLGPNHYQLLVNVLQGLYEIKKKPWEPKFNERYYMPSASSQCVYDSIWKGYTLDYAMKLLDMVYKTREEAEAHLSEDYERLTGKPLSSR